MINIIGGKYKGKKLEVPKGNVRPTTSHKRESIFSKLESIALKNNYELYNNKCFIDLFAGTGSLGLESISRGASFAYFFEINSKVSQILKKNCLNICQKNHFKIIEQDSSKVHLNKKNIILPIAAIFIDPPYKTNPIKNILHKFIKEDILDNETIIIIESEKNTKFEITENYNLINQKIYGKTKIAYLQKSRKVLLS